MRIPRLFTNADLQIGTEVQLPLETAHYILHVLRLRLNAEVRLFNGKGGEYSAQLIRIAKKNVYVLITAHHAIDCESPLMLTLVQAVSKPEHMDYAIQKSVELGVTHIIPVMTERSPPLDKQRFAKRESHWQKIIHNACEQCGRNRIPTLSSIMPLFNWLEHPKSGHYFVLAPTSQTHLSLTTPIDFAQQGITVLVGTEGGLTKMEIDSAVASGYQAIQLGKRILRTETAATTILTICQTLWGDLIKT